MAKPSPRKGLPNVSAGTNREVSWLQTLNQSNPAQSEKRNTRGKWRPPLPRRILPPFCLAAAAAGGRKGPLGQLAGLHAWPAPSISPPFSTLAWFFTQPALARCAEFRLDWIAQIYLRNIGLMWLVYGGFYLYLYIFKAEGTKTKYDARWPARNSRLFLFNDQVYDNIFLDLRSRRRDLDRLGRQ